MPISNPTSGAPAGAIAYMAANAVPNGWIKANGAAISRTTYAALFLVIGTTHGAGNGSTTFALPDLRGEFLRSLDDGRGVDSGRGIGTAQGHQMQGHSHTIALGQNYGEGSIIASWTNSPYPNQNSVNSSLSGGTNNSSENRPRNSALLACIKY